MKTIKQFILSGCILLTGCASDKSNVSESIIKETGNEERVTAQIVHDNLPYGIKDMIAVDSLIVCHTESESPVYICYNASDFEKKKEFGTIGRGYNEWIKPHLVARTNNGYDIFDNGKNSILRYSNDSLVSEVAYKKMVAVNNPHIINKKYSGYTYLEPNKTALVIYDADTYELTDEFAFEDKEQKGNAINWDFIWDGKENCIVIGHLYKKEFYVIEMNHMGKISQCIRYIGDYAFDPEKHMYYSDVNISNGLIYLLSQQHVNLETGNGYSEIDIFDKSGKHIKKMILDVVAQHMCVTDNSVWLLDIDNNISVVTETNK